MLKKRKFWTIFLIGFTIILIGGGGTLLWFTAPAHFFSTEQVQISFPMADTSNINAIQGYGMMTWGDFHNGIDIGTNTSVELIAWCDLRITALKTWFNEAGGHWQTNIGCSYNWKYKFDVAVESWALNESYANLQRQAITIKVGEIVKQGESLGFLLWHGEGTHIHFGLKERGRDVCPYQFMTLYTQSLIDHYFSLYGSGGTICGE